MEFIHTHTKKGGLSLAGMVSIIGHRGYEDGKKIGQQLRTLVEKEVDRAKKKIADERREFITRHEKKCRVCESKVKIKDKDSGRNPIFLKEEDTLLCQECYLALSHIDWGVEKAEKIVEFLKATSGE